MEIPGLDTLYEIYKRSIERRNDALKQRKELADELMENCRKWVLVLTETFDDAFAKCDRTENYWDGLDIIRRQMQDLSKLDYRSLRDDSEILTFLREDPRFKSFADACVDFYTRAVDSKKETYLSIEREEGCSTEVEKAKRQVTHALYETLEEVAVEYRKVKIISSK